MLRSRALCSSSCRWPLSPPPPSLPAFPRAPLFAASVRSLDLSCTNASSMLALWSPPPRREASLISERTTPHDLHACQFIYAFTGGHRV